MKTIGIIGGMSYESTIHYYERINNQVNKKVGGLTCAKMLIKPEDLNIPIFDTTQSHIDSIVDYSLEIKT